MEKLFVVFLWDFFNVNVLIGEGRLTKMKQFLILKMI